MPSKNFQKLAASTLATIGLLITTSLPANADSIRDRQWHLQYLKIEEAHGLSRGSGITVAVVDSGVMQHKDLRKNLLPGSDIVDSEQSNGLIDEDGHGTRMAGIIAAHGRGSSGVLGIAPGAKVISIRNTVAGDNVDHDDVVLGVRAATRDSVDVMNVSLSSPPSVALDRAVEEALQKDIVMVAGTGNWPAVSTLRSPADIPGVLAVGAIDRDGKRAKFSLTGEEVQLCAPGVDIATTNNKDGYSLSEGTSAATAIVSGAAALVRSKFPDLSGPEVVHRLTVTADDIGPRGRDDECGFGVLNIVSALTADVPPLAIAPSPSQPASPPTAATPAPTAGRQEIEPAANHLPTIAGGVGILVIAGFVGLLTARQIKKKPSNS